MGSRAQRSGRSGRVRWRRATSILAVIPFLAVAAGCGGGSDTGAGKQVTIDFVWWGNDGPDAQRRGCGRDGAGRTA